MMEHETNGSSSLNKENPRNASGKFSRALNFYEKHFRFGRFLQAFYLLLIIGGFQMFLIFGLPYLPNPRLSRIHIVLPFLVVFFTVFTFSLASASSPGYVTSVNFSRLEKIYPYDNFLFIQGRVCPTCGTPKVARSKHCSFKGRCVERYDHYCPWIDNTIGCLNQRFFLLFVVSTEILLIYAVFILWNILYFIVETNTLFDLQYFIPTTNQLVSADLFIVAKFMFYHYPTLTFLFSICTIMGMFLFCFILYQVYLIYNGFTTNEFYKWRYIYPYDNFIFVKRECTTCHTPRVARSKHCRMQNRCVEKYDHFCPWINNTVGCFNFRYFLLFVFTTAAFLAYATYVFWQLIVFIIERDGLWNVKFLHPTTKQVVNADLFIIIQYLMTSQGPLVFMFVLCLVMALTVTLFFLFQLWLILDGTTSNESTKWGLVKDFYQSKKWKAELEKRSKDFPEDETLLQEHQDSLDERLTKHFPSKMPSNSYDRGSFWRNFKEVLFPHEFREQLYQQNYGRVKRLSDQTSKAPQEVEDSQTHSNTKLVSKQKRKKGP